VPLERRAGCKVAHQQRDRVSSGVDCPGPWGPMRNAIVARRHAEARDGAGVANEGDGAVPGTVDDNKHAVASQLPCGDHELQHTGQGATRQELGRARAVCRPHEQGQQARHRSRRAQGQVRRQRQRLRPGVCLRRAVALGEGLLHPGCSRRRRWHQGAGRAARSVWPHTAGKQHDLARSPTGHGAEGILLEDGVHGHQQSPAVAPAAPTGVAGAVHVARKRGPLQQLAVPAEACARIPRVCRCHWGAISAPHWRHDRQAAPADALCGQCRRERRGGGGGIHGHDDLSGGTADGTQRTHQEPQSQRHGLGWGDGSRIAHDDQDDVVQRLRGAGEAMQCTCRQVGRAGGGDRGGKKG